MLEPTLASIQQHVFTPVCTACHSGAAAQQGLRLEAGLSYGMLVDIPSVGVPSIDRVEPGNPDASYLIDKLEGTQAVGARMPFGGPYLEQEIIDTIRAWIAAGAPAGAPPTEPGAKVAGTWPAPEGYLYEPPAQVLVVFDRALDATRIDMQLSRIDGVHAQRLDARVEIANEGPTTLRLTLPPAQWTPGTYEVLILGAADLGGWPIDGDGDGFPGGDFVMQFEIEGATP